MGVEEVWLTLPALGSVSRKFQELFGPEKPVVKPESDLLT